MSDGAPITVIAAASNEASLVPEWLENLRWVDRVVVCVTGSADGTAERLEEGGAEVVLGDDGTTLVHAAKNRALAQVHAGWVLDLDLDERVSVALRREIETVVEGDSNLVAYRLPFEHYVFGRWLRHGGWRTRHLRLYRAGTATYPEDRAHSTLEVAGDVGDLEARVQHFAHPTLHDFVTKMNRYTTHDAPLIVEHGRGGLRNRVPLPPKGLRWLGAAASVFWSRYVKERGFRDGMQGFLVAWLVAAYTLVEQAKVWEARLGSSPEGAPRGDS